MVLEMKPHHVQTYKDATDNLMFLKREQVQITFYTWMLLAALYILSTPDSNAVRITLAIGVVVVALLSVIALWRFYNDMQEFRARLKYIYENYFTPEEQKGFGFDATKSHLFMTRLLTAVCLVASLFTFCVIAARVTF